MSPVTPQISVSKVLPFELPLAKGDRNSLIQYNANSFEFCGLGSAQNVCLANTILASIVNTTVAKKFAQFADQIEASEKPNTVAKVVLEQHLKNTVDGDRTHNDEATGREIQFPKRIHLMETSHW